MVGSAAVGWYIAQAAFWLLVMLAILKREMSIKTIAIFVVLWALGFIGLRGYFLGGAFTAFVAVLDIALVLAIFKGDVRIY